MLEKAKSGDLSRKDIEEYGYKYQAYIPTAFEMYDIEKKKNEMKKENKQTGGMDFEFETKDPTNPNVILQTGSVEKWEKNTIQTSNVDKWLEEKQTEKREHYQRDENKKQSENKRKSDINKFTNYAIIGGAGLVLYLILSKKKE